MSMDGKDKIRKAREIMKHCRETGECDSCEMGLQYPGVIQCKVKLLDMIIDGLDECCEQCKWRSDDFTSVCVCSESVYRGAFVDADDTCDEWEKRNENG